MIWQSLLDQALKVIDNAKIQPEQWRFGGGTVLMITYNHRMSKDIDLFFSDLQLLDYVSPRTNDALEDVMGDYVDDHLFKRYILEEGKIDFIKGVPVTNIAPEILRHNNRSIFTDHPVEIVAKKIFYRCDEFKARDIFDQAVVIMNGYEDDLLQFCSAHPDQTAKALSRTTAMIDDGALEIGLDALDILEGGQAAYQRCTTLIPEFFKKALLLSKS